MQAEWRSTIGLEIHVELKTRSKMFCRCSTDYFGHEPNTHVCPVCLGLPGALPVANKRAIEMTALTGIALGCQIPSFSKFDRKNYFYPDLPKGFQISQYDLPFGTNGKLDKIRIKRVHLEEDTAKLIHSGKNTLIDFNRSGVPLMEVVTEPDMTQPQEAKEWVKRLQQILRYLKVSDCDMEKGSMRLEANVSVKRKETRGIPDYKVEIKNLNSFRFVEKALNYEIKRQTQLLKQEKAIIQETRGWEETKQKTYTQRWKEEAQDYRYFPEPDLPPIRWSKKQLAVINKQLSDIKKQLPESHEERSKRIKKSYNLTDYQSLVSTATIEKTNFIEKAVELGIKENIDPRVTVNYITSRQINYEKDRPEQIIDDIVEKRKISKTSEKKLRSVVAQVIEENKGTVDDYHQGKTSAAEFLVGQVMRQTKGAADPNQTRKMLLEKLKSKK